MEVQGHVEGLGKLCSKIVAYNIDTGKVDAFCKFRLLHSALACFNAWLDINNRGMQTKMFAAEEYTVCGMRSTNVEHLRGSFGYVYTVDQFTAKCHCQ